MKEATRIRKNLNKDKNDWINAILREIYALENSDNDSLYCEDICLDNGYIGATVIC